MLTGQLMIYRHGLDELDLHRANRASCQPKAPRSSGFWPILGGIRARHGDPHPKRSGVAGITWPECVSCAVAGTEHVRSSCRVLQVSARR